LSGYGGVFYRRLSGDPTDPTDTNDPPVTNEPPVNAFVDFGDAPDGPGEPNYPTTLARDGARHIIVGNGPRLGQLEDPDPGTRNDTTATADDATGLADEDGVTFLTPLLPNCSAQLSVVASKAAKLDAWVDFNRDGDWNDLGERIINNTSVNQGTNSVSFPVPAGAVYGSTFARFRISTEGRLTFFGLAEDGEVEDYAVLLGTPLGIAMAGTPGQLELSWQDACELYVLQHTERLAPLDWQDVSAGTLSGGFWRHIITVGAKTGYYRLRRLP
jgi:hypothetical protein